MDKLITDWLNGTTSYHSHFKNIHLNEALDTIRPYIGFLKEKARFGKTVSPSAQHLHDFSEQNLRYVVNAGARFIAKSGTELKTFLDDIVALPAGKTYNGNMYRSIGNQYNNPLEIHVGAINSNYRYSKPGEGGLYLSKTQSGNVTEISHYGDISGYKTYEYANVQIDNMLDLTDDVVRQKLGVDFDLLTRYQNTGDDLVDAAFNYELTHEIGTWASNNGYKGIIVSGARGSKDYVNTIIFKQADVDAALSNIAPNIINN